MSREAAVAVRVAFGVGALLATCGSTIQTATAISPNVRVARAKTAESISKRRAREFARAVNLRAADIPGFKLSSESEHETAAEKQLGDEFARCVGVTGLSRPLIEAHSGPFEHESHASNLEVSSDVTVLRTSTSAKRDIAQFRSDRFGKCLEHYMTLALKPLSSKGVTISPVAVSRLTLRGPGAEEGFGWRVSVTYRGRRLDVTFRTDLLGFVDGPAVVVLSADGAPLPFPAITEHRLFSLLARRAAAHTI
jgi:hypothetical protein